MVVPMQGMAHERVLPNEVLVRYDKIKGVAIDYGSMRLGAGPAMRSATLVLPLCKRHARGTKAHDTDGHRM